MKGLLNCRLPDPRFDLALPSSIWLAPICEKPLLEYCLELFLYLGISEVMLVDYLANGEISAHFGTGSAWGLKLSYLQGMPGEVISETLERLAPGIHDDLLIIDGPLFPLFDRAALKPLHMPAREGIYSLNQRHLNLTDTILLMPRSLMHGLLAENRFEKWVQASLDYHPEIRFPVVPLHNLTAYLQINLEVMARGERFELPARAEQGIWKGRQVQVADNVTLLPPVWLGSETQIGDNCQVSRSLLSGQVRLEQATVLEECLVFGPSYLSGQKLQRKIILGQRCLHPATGQMEELAQPWALQNQIESPDREAKFQRELAWVEPFLRWRRPLFKWLKGFARANQQNYFSNAEGQILTLDVFKPRKNPALPEKLFFQWGLDKVPLMEAVLAGELCLVGNTLIPVQGSASSFVQQLPIYAPGVFSYSQLLHPERAPVWLDELHYCSAASETFDTWILEQSLEKWV
ncbi:MAG: hypothetical protein AB7I41_13935 [Candidatus Sericytochromatia bacterium]